MKTLVVGCDASGKSTFLENVAATYNDVVGESSRSEQAQLFKLNSLSRLVDGEFINEREALYLELSHQALITMAALEQDVVTTDSSLVTRLSHNVMRQVIGEQSLSNTDIIDAWLSDEILASAAQPDIFVLTHAAPSTIRGRILSRQKTGDTSEKFWGFNSPYFLDAYQERWLGLFSDLSTASFNCLVLNTDTETPEDMLSTYDGIRTSLSSN